LLGISVNSQPYLPSLANPLVLLIAATLTTAPSELAIQLSDRLFYPQSLLSYRYSFPFVGKVVNDSHYHLWGILTHTAIFVKIQKDTMTKMIPDKGRSGS